MNRMHLNTNVDTEYNFCTCYHSDRIHRDMKYKCRGCSCTEFKYSDQLMRETVRTLSVTISMDCDIKFRNMVRLRHGIKKGALSFEVERALREAMGEKNLDVLMNDNEWKLLNK